MALGLAMVSKAAGGAIEAVCPHGARPGIAPLPHDGSVLFLGFKRGPTVLFVDGSMKLWHPSWPVLPRKFGVLRAEQAP